MTLANWMVLAAAFLPWITTGIAKAGAPDFDNARTQDGAARQRGWRARALAAHRNHFEAFPPFAAAVILAEQFHAPQSRVDALAAVFVLARIAYTAAYIADRASVRSGVWFVGVACVVWLFLLPA